MSHTIDFYYDFLSPYSYLALTQLAELASRSGAKIVYKPIEVLKVMARVGNSPTTVQCAAKGKYAIIDLARWAKIYDVPLVRNPHHRSIDGRPLLLGAVAAGRRGQAAAYTRAIFEGVWIRQSGFADDAETLDMLLQGGFEGGEAVLAARNDAQAELDSLIDEAVETGVFGVPSFKVGDSLFFGNDRLDFLAQELNR